MAVRLSYEDFLKSFELAPRLAIELLVENSKGELLLMRREKEPFAGQWHLPGGFLLKDEPINDCIRRVAKDELDLLIEIENLKKLELFETLTGDPRGHIIHFPVKISCSDISGKSYFASLPKNTIVYQLEFLKKLGYRSE